LKLANNKVETRWKLNTPRYNFGMCEWKHKDQRRLYLVGGQDIEGRVTNSVE